MASDLEVQRRCLAVLGGDRAAPPEEPGVADQELPPEEPADQEMPEASQIPLDARLARLAATITEREHVVGKHPENPESTHTTGCDRATKALV